MTIHWKAVEQYFTVVPLVFQFSSVCNLENSLSILDLDNSLVWLIKPKFLPAKVDFWKYLFWNSLPSGLVNAKSLTLFKRLVSSVN